MAGDNAREHTGDASGAGAERAASGRAAALSPWRFVVVFGVVSLLADAVYEGARSITGPYLGSLGAGAVLVGVVTGAGEAAGLVLRLVSGPATEWSGRYWGWTIAGYGLTVVAVPALALPVGLAGACVLVVAERVGKATRSPAKDTLLSHAGSPMGRGTAFAVHEALDQTGAFAGPLLVAAAVAWHGYGLGFAILAVPGIAVMIVLLWLARRVPDPRVYEAGAERTPAEPPAMGSAAVRGRAPLAGLGRVFWRYAVFSAVTMAGFATFGLIGFHLVEADLVRPQAVPLVYAGAMAVDAVAALATGRLFDRWGLRVLVTLPVLAGAGTALAFAGSLFPALAGAALWGAAMGVQESTMRAAVADLVPAARRPTAYGAFAAVYGTAWLVGGAALGALYGHAHAALVPVVLSVQAVALAALWWVNSAAAPDGRTTA
ncbi:MFS transporter [Actinomadura sp. NPDC000600]|uniref:MFS transporter n=1 Tax=Actinomadura sp. NPDC000600 TaxID=3154262 RepID=UPI0033968F57